MKIFNQNPCSLLEKFSFKDDHLVKIYNFDNIQINLLRISIYFKFQLFHLISKLNHFYIKDCSRTKLTGL